MKTDAQFFEHFAEFFEEKIEEFGGIQHGHVLELDNAIVEDPEVIVVYHAAGYEGTPSAHVFAQFRKKHGFVTCRHNTGPESEPEPEPDSGQLWIEQVELDNRTLDVMEAARTGLLDQDPLIVEIREALHTTNRLLQDLVDILKYSCQVSDSTITNSK